MNELLTDEEYLAAALRAIADMVTDADTDHAQVVALCRAIARTTLAVVGR